MKNKRLNLRDTMLWNSTGLIYYLGCQWIISVLVTRLAGYHAAGSFSLAMACTGTFFALAQFGVRQFQVSDINGEYSSGTYIVARIFTCAAAGMLCFGYVFLYGYGKQQAICILLYMLFKITEAIIDVLQGIQQTIWRLDLAGISCFARGTLSVVTFFILLKQGFNLNVAILSMSAVSFLVILGWDIPQTKRLEYIKLQWRFADVVCLLKACVALLAYTLSISILTYIPRQMAAQIIGTEQLGIYATVATPVLIVQVCASFVFNPLVPLFAENYQKGNRKAFQSLFVRCILSIAGLLVVALGGSALFGAWGLNLLFGNVAARHAYLLPAIVVTTVLVALSGFLAYILIAIRLTKPLYLCAISSILVVLFMANWFIEKTMLQGISYAIITGLLVQCGVLIPFVWSKVNKRFKETQIKDETT